MTNYSDAFYGVEVEIKDVPEIIRNPGPIYHNIQTADPARSLRLEVQMGRDRMTILPTDPYGAPVWIRHFNFIHTDQKRSPWIQ